MSKPPHRTTDRDLDQRLISAEIMTNPYPIYAELRQRFPLFWSDHWSSWIVSRYDDVRTTLTDNDTLSNERRQEQLFASWTSSQREQLAPLRHYFSQRDVIGSDPPEHNRIRKLVARAFTPRTITSLTPRIAQLATELLTAAASNGQPFDFIAAVAHPLPVIVIAEMLGAPPADRDLFKRWSADILAFQGTGTTTVKSATRSQTSLLELFDYMSVLVDDRRRHPQDDVITALALAEADGNRLSRDELLSSCNTLLTAGHETTTNLLGNLVRLLLRTPAAWARVVENPSLGTAAIEEALRFDAPKQRNFRRVLHDHDRYGVTLRENDMLFQLIGAANHDPAAFPHPDHFDITRSPNEHLAFGLGIHFCLGGPLARAEARIMLDTLRSLTPHLTLAGPHDVWQQRQQFRGPAELWLTALPPAATRKVAAHAAEMPWTGRVARVPGDAAAPRQSRWRRPEGDPGPSGPKDAHQLLMIQRSQHYAAALAALLRFILAHLGDPEAIVVLDETA